MYTFINLNLENKYRSYRSIYIIVYSYYLNKSI